MKSFCCTDGGGTDCSNAVPGGIYNRAGIFSKNGGMVVVEKSTVDPFCNQRDVDSVEHGGYGTAFTVIFEK